MVSSTMLTSLLQTTVLFILCLLVKQHFDNDDTFYGLLENEGLKNYTAALNSKASAAANGTLAMGNTTVPAQNSTLGSESTVFDTSSFASMALSVFFQALVFPLLYYWHIWLERKFPARPRGVDVAYDRTEKVKVDDDLNEVQEGVVVQKWIAQGKVRRSSLSLWNTLIKWLLHLTLGSIWYDALWKVMWTVISLEPLSDIAEFMHPGLIMFRLLSEWFSMFPVWYFTAFALVPAPHRAVFVTAASLVWLTFTRSFLRVVVPWAVNTSYAQEMLRNMTEVTLRGTGEGAGHLLDEL